jgi:hypothetical protein
MEKPPELFETELAEIREELRRLGVHPRENLQQSSAIQKELLEDWQEASHYWVNRMQSEVALWAELGSRLATTRSATEALDAYAKCVAQQMKMSVEDGFRFIEELQGAAQKLTQSSTKNAFRE